MVPHKRTWLGLLGVAAVVAACMSVAAYRDGLWPLPQAAASTASQSRDEAGAVRVEIPQWNATLEIVAGTRVDFGQVKPGQELTHSFRIRNTGSRPVPLGKLRMTCACNATAEYERDECPPGESCSIRVSTKAAGYGPQMKTLPFARVVEGRTQTLFELTLSYRIAWIEHAAFVPARVDLGLVPDDDGVITRDIQLVLVGPPDGPPPELFELAPGSAALGAAVKARETPEVNEVTAHTVPAQRAIYQLELTIDPASLPAGVIHQHLKAKTSLGEVPLPIHGFHGPAAIAAPVGQSIPVLAPGVDE